MEWKKNWSCYALFLAFTTVGLHARLSNLSSESLWLDEAYNVYWAGQPIRDILTQAAADAKLFTLLQKFTFAIFGESDFVVRLVPLIASMITAVFVFRAARLISGPWAWVASSLCLVYPQVINYSRIGRPNAFLLMSAAGFLWMSLRFLKEPRRSTIMWAIAAWLLVLYSHKSGYFLGPLLLVLIWLQSDFAKKEMRFVLGALLFACICCLPLLAAELSAMEFSKHTYANAMILAGGMNPWWYPLNSIYNLAPPTRTWIAFHHALYLVPLGLSLAVWQWQVGKRIDKQMVFLGALLFIPTIFMSVMSVFGFPVYIVGRNDLALLLPMILLPIHGLAIVNSAWLRSAMSVGIVLSLLPYHLYVAEGKSTTFRGADRENAIEISNAMMPQDACILVGHVYFSYERYLDSNKRPQCTGFGVDAVLNTAALPLVPIEVLLPPHIVSGARIWIVAPQDDFTRGDYLERAKATVNEMARNRGLTAQEEAHSVKFDMQGMALIVKYTLSDQR